MPWLCSSQKDQALEAWGELFVQLAPLIVIMGLVGIVMIVGLLVTWRRFQHRERKLSERLSAAADPSMQPDAWSTAAQRMEPARSPAPPKPSYDEPPFDEDEPGYDEGFEQDEEDDEDAPWRESLGDIPDFGAGDDDPDEDWGGDDEEEDDWPRPG